MNTTIRGNNLSTPGIPGNSDSPIGSASTGAHAAVDSLAGAAGEAARRLTPAIDKVAAIAHSAVDSAASAAAPTATWLAEHAESLKSSQKKLLSDSCAYVSAHPIQSVGIAIVLGIVLGRVIR